MQFNISIVLLYVSKLSMDQTSYIKGEGGKFFWDMQTVESMDVRKLKEVESMDVGKLKV